MPTPSSQCLTAIKHTLFRSTFPYTPTLKVVLSTIIITIKIVMKIKKYSQQSSPHWREMAQNKHIGPSVWQHHVPLEVRCRAPGLARWFMEAPRRDVQLLPQHLTGNAAAPWHALQAPALLLYLHARMATRSLRMKLPKFVDAWENEPELRWRGVGVTFIAQ